MQQIAKRKTSSTSRKNPTSKKIEDVVNPTPTMRLHQRLFDRRRKHHIDVKDGGESRQSPGRSLSTYLISPKYHKPRARKAVTLAPVTPLVPTGPSPVIQYSQITRVAPPGYASFAEGLLGHTRPMRDRIVQRYRVFRTRHKPFHYSFASGATSSWLSGPRARVALVGSALALLLFFAGNPYAPPSGPDNPAGGKDPIVIQGASNGSSLEEAGTEPAGATSTTPDSNAPPATTNAGSTHMSYPGPAAATATPAINPPVSEGGRGSGIPDSDTPTTPAPPPVETSIQPSSPIPSNPIDVIKPTPVTIPGQDVIVDDKRIIKTSDAEILIN